MYSYDLLLLSTYTNIEQTFKRGYRVSTVDVGAEVNKTHDGVQVALLGRQVQRRLLVLEHVHGKCGEVAVRSWR